MEDYYQFQAQNHQWYNKAQSYRRRAHRQGKRWGTAPRVGRAMLIIDGAYFEQGTAKYMVDKFGINLFDTNAPELLIENFVKTIEEWLNVECIHRYFITALLDENPAHKALLLNQYAMIEALETKGHFNIDCREFKNMSVFGPNKHCGNSARPINRKVQAEVDVAIATQALGMAYEDEYDMLIAITGDRDFTDGFKAIAFKAQKLVKVCGFYDSVWQGYYDPSSGIEVIEAEALWNRSIGKALLFKPSEPSKKKDEISDNNSEQNVFSSFKKRPNSQKRNNGRNVSQGNKKANSSFRKQKQNNKKNKKSQNKAENRKSRLSKFELSNVSEDKEMSDLTDADYFDKISLKTKESLINDYHVDPFTAELALYITNGNSEACQEFLSHK